MKQKPKTQDDEVTAIVTKFMKQASEAVAEYTRVLRLQTAEDTGERQ